jgi:hypothetical protein
MHEESSPNEERLWRYSSYKKNVETKSKKYRKLRENLKPDEVYPCELFLSDYNSLTLDKDLFSKYIRARANVSEVLNKYYGSEDLSTHEIKDKDLLPFRKIKLSSYISIQQSNKRLVRNFKDKFGENAVMILGNWSAGMKKYYEPIRGVGMRRMLKKEGLTVYLLAEYKTSSFCPSCKAGKLEKFKKVANPRVYMKDKHPTILHHGLLR